MAKGQDKPFLVKKALIKKRITCYKTLKKLAEGFVNWRRWYASET
jgi:hypothetical protein